MPRITIDVDEQTFTRLAAVSILLGSPIPVFVLEWILLCLDEYVHNISA